MKKISVVSLLLLMLSTAHAQSPQELLQQANDAYTRSEYSYAIELYQQITSQGFMSADLYYNLGNAYFKNNQLGRAILNYERALRLRPMDEDIRHNLTIARNRTIDRMEQRPLLFYERWWLAAWSMQGLDGWAITSLILIFLTLSLVALYLFSRTIVVKKVSFFMAALILGLSLLSLGFTRKQYKRLNSEREAIVMQPRVTIKSSPSQQSQDLFLLHEGTKVRIRNSLGQWHEISLPNGNVGWMREEAFELI